MPEIPVVAEIGVSVAVRIVRIVRIGIVRIVTIVRNVAIRPEVRAEPVGKLKIGAASCDVKRIHEGRGLI